MMSAYMCEFVSFNVLDKDYVEDKQKMLENKDTDPINEEDIIPEIVEQ